MTDFDQRWQHLASQARLAAEQEEGVPPFLAARILARVRQAGGEDSEAGEDLLSFFGLRALAITAVLLLLSAGFAVEEWYEIGIQPPALERAITSELSIWP